jgi:hypothetical protein
MKIIPYTCPRCDYKNKDKYSIRRHLYDRTQECPAYKNDIELTDEIKEYILKNRVYQIPKPPKTPKKPQTIIITPNRNNEIIPQTNKKEENIIFINEETKEEFNLINTLDERLYEILKEEMKEDEQKQFINSFKIYLEHGDDDTKFIISLDDVWEWVGFTRKDNAKTLLTKNFIENKDYIIEVSKKSLSTGGPAPAGPPSKGGNKKTGEKEIILLNVSTFKKFCMKASTTRANDICNYYIKMEKVLQQYTKEKLNQLQEFYNKFKKTELIKECPINMDKFFWDDNLISNFNYKCVIYLAYIGIIDGIYIFKYGVTKQVDIREFKQHKSTFEFFQMVHIEVCDNMYFVESQLQKVLESKCLLRKIMINNKTQTEIFTITKEHTLEKIIEIVKELVLNHPLESIKEKDSELIKLKEYYENEKIKRNYEFQLEKKDIELEKLKLINETQLKEQKLINEIEKLISENEKQKLITENKELEVFYLKELNKMYTSSNK